MAIGGQEQAFDSTAQAVTMKLGVHEQSIGDRRRKAGNDCYPPPTVTGQRSWHSNSFRRKLAKRWISKMTFHGVRCKIDEVMEGLTDLIRSAESLGAPVTHRRLKSWWNEDLIPRPNRRGLGRGAGTELVFPPGTARQLGRLIALRRWTDSPSKLRSQLWLLGYPVPWVRVQTDLLAEWLLATPRLSDTAIDQAAIKLASDLANERRPVVWRHGLGRVELESLAFTAVSLVSRGRVPFDLSEKPHDDESMPVGEVLERALGLWEARRAPDWLTGPPGGIAAAAIQFGGFNFEALRESLACASPEEAELAREALRSGQDAPGTRRAMKWADREPQFLAGMVAATLLAFRNLPQFEEALSRKEST